MSEPYVNVYEPEAAPLREAMDKLDLEPVQKIVKKAGEDLYSHLLDSVNDYLQSNLGDAIDGAARSLASRYLAEALAGDEEQLKRLFGCWHTHEASKWSLLEGRYPDNWALLRALCEKFPDLLRTELLGQYEIENAHLRTEVALLRAHNEQYRRQL